MAKAVDIKALNRRRRMLAAYVAAGRKQQASKNSTKNGR